jgi:dienelactone hydrolase
VGLPAPWLWGRLARGPYAIGLDVESDSDTTRIERLTSGAMGPRPLELVVWYPTAHNNLARDTVRFSTYVDLSDGSMLDVANRTDDGRRRWLAGSLTPQPDSVRREIVDSILRSPMAATRDAAPATERFPVILWSTRHATPAAQSVMSEYLASHGYVVAWMRYAGLDSLRPPFDDVPPARKAATLEAHVADMQRAIRRLAAHPAVDSTRVGVAAWSYSGEPATVLAQRTPSIRVLVGLSTNLFVSSYRGVDIAASTDSLPLRAGVIMLEETGAVRGRPRTAPDLLDRLPGKAYRVTFPALAHGNFNALEGMIPALIGVSTVQPWSVAGPAAQDGYESISRAVVSLLGKTLKGASGDGGFAPSAGIEVLRHGPGRGVSAVDGTSFVDTRVVIPSDGWQLVGDFVHGRSVASRGPAVLMLNKANGDRRVYANVARELARRGVASLRLDLRGEGESTNLGSFVPSVPNEHIRNAHRDVIAALQWLRVQPGVDTTRLGVIGASYSGEEMAVAARAGFGASAYVALSPGSLSAQTIDAIDGSGAKWWILRSRDERFVRDVVDAARARSRLARVTEVSGRAHATDMLMSTPMLAAEMADWLVSALAR